MSQLEFTKEAMGVPHPPVFTVAAPLFTSAGTLAAFRGQNHTEM